VISAAANRQHPALIQRKRGHTFHISCARHRNRARQIRGIALDLEFGWQSDGIRLLLHKIFLPASLPVTDSQPWRSYRFRSHQIKPCPPPIDPNNPKDPYGRNSLHKYDPSLACSAREYYTLLISPYNLPTHWPRFPSRTPFELLPTTIIGKFVHSNVRTRPTSSFLHFDRACARPADCICCVLGRLMPFRKRAHVPGHQID